MKKPQLSVIIPIHNAAPYLHRALKSIVNQTFKDFEVLLINDESTDESVEIASEYLKYPFIKLINTNRGGVSRARNIGIKNATGEWVTFMDADDWIETSFYESYFNEIKKNEETCDIIFSGYIRELSSGNYKKISLSPSYVHDNLSITIEYLYKVEAFGWAWNKLFKRSIIELNQIYFEPTIQLREDELFTLKYCKHVNSIQIISASLYHYMMNNNSLVHKKRNYIDYQRVSDQLYKEYHRYFDNKRFQEKYKIDYASGIFYSLTTIYTGETPASKEQRLAFIKKFIKARKQLAYPYKIRYRANKYKNLIFKCIFLCDNICIIDSVLKLLIRFF